MPQSIENEEIYLITDVDTRLDSESLKIFPLAIPKAARNLRGSREQT